MQGQGRDLDLERRIERALKDRTGQAGRDLWALIMGKRGGPGPNPRLGDLVVVQARRSDPNLNLDLNLGPAGQFRLNAPDVLSDTWAGSGGAGPAGLPVWIWIAGGSAVALIGGLLIWLGTRQKEAA